MHHRGDNREVMVDQQTLLEDARKGNQAAFTALAQRYQEMALGYALAILGDFHLAQDATQEALFAAYRGMRSLEAPHGFRPGCAGSCASSAATRGADRSYP